jgi:hypothetical protein
LGGFGGSNPLQCSTGLRAQAHSFSVDTLAELSEQRIRSLQEAGGQEQHRVSPL